MSGIYHWLAAVHWGRVGTWALAIGTFSLAFFTWRVSRAAIKTLDQNKLLVVETHRLVEGNNTLIESEERHHKENLRPLCVFAHTGNLHNILTLDMRNGRNRVIIDSDIENKGNGVAKAIKIIFRLASPRCEGCLTLGPLASGSKYFNGAEKHYSETIPLELSCKNDSNILHTDFLLQQQWAIYMEYEDIFNAKFYTIYIKNDSNADIEFSSDPLPSLEDDEILERLVAEIR